MAEYKNSIKLGISLPQSSDIQGKLNNVIKSLNDTKINLDINILNSDTAKQLETLTSLTDNFKNSLGGNISLGNINEIINKTTSAMENLSGELLKTSTTNFKDIITNTQTLATNIGEVTKQTSKFQELNGELKPFGETVVTVTNNVEKFNSAMQQITNAQKSLDGLKLNGIIDISSIDKLKADLNTIYEESNKENGIKFSDYELKNYLNEVKQLENEEKNNIQLANKIQDAWDKAYSDRVTSEQSAIQQIESNEKKAYDNEISLLGQQALAEQKAEQDLINQMANGREKSELKSQQTDRSQELAQSKAINQALIEQKQILVQQEEAYKQIDVLKANGIINSSDITKLEKMVQEANSLKDMKTALNSIMNTSMMNESSIVTLSKQLEDAQIRLDKMKSAFGSKLPQGFVESTQSEINKLKEDLTNVDGMNFNGIKNSLNQVNTEMKVTTNETQQLVNNLKETNGGFFTGISDFLAKAGLFYGVAQAVQEVRQQFTNCFEQAEKLNQAFTDISITMEISKEQFSDMSDKITQMGVEYGKSGNEIMTIAKTYANAQSSVEEVISKVKPDVWLANVSRIDSADITKTLQSVNNQFGLMSKEGMNAEQATTKIGNSLVAVSKNMQFDFVDGIKKMTDAIKRGGSVAENSKMSMDEYMSMAGAFIQQTGLEGSEFANSLKMISARVLKQKELGAELGISESEMADAEKTLKQFDITTRDTTTGGLRSLTDILKDTSVAFNNASDSDKQYIANKLAGVNQSSKFIAIMKSMDTTQLLYNATQTDTNALMDAQTKYADSLEGKLGSLKATYEGLMNKAMNSDQAKFLVTEATEFLNVLGRVDGKTLTFIGTIGLATVAISKLATMNKLLMETASANALTNGFTKFVGILTGMTPLMGTTTVATQALVEVQAEATLANEMLAQAEARVLLATEALTVAQEGQSTSSFQVAVAEGEVMLATDALTIAQTNATVATEALTVAQAEASAEQAGLTGLSGVWTLLSNGIKGATVASLEFLTTPVGIAIASLATVVIIAGKAFYDYKQHQAEVEAQSKTLKDAINGVNEAIKDGDTKGASSQLDKLTESEKKYQDALEKKKKLEKEIADVSDDMKNHPLNTEGDLQVLNALQGDLIDVTKELDTQNEAFKKAGVSANDYANAQQLVKDAKIVDTIKEETKAQVEHRTNTEANTEAYNNYISTVQTLYGEYQNLSSQENLSSEQKTQLASVVEQLQGKIGNLDSQMDANGKTYITNEGLISDTISYMNSEGENVEVLTQIKLQDEKSNATWQYNNSSITYQQTLQRIQYYQAEVKNIQALMAAREASQTSETGMSADGTSFEMTANEKKRRQTANQDQVDSLNDQINKLQAGKDAIDKLYTSMTIPNAPSKGGNSGSEDFGGTGGSSKKGSSGSGGKSADTLAKEADKSAVKEITDAYDKAKDQIDNDVSDIQDKLDELGNDVTPGDKVDAYTQQISKQTELLGKAKDELASLQGVSASTSEGQNELETATKKANSEIRSQESAIRKLNDQLKSLANDNVKKLIETEKSLAEKQQEINFANQKTGFENTDYKTSESEYNTYKQNRINSINEEISKLKDLKSAGEDTAYVDQDIAEKEQEISELNKENYNTVANTQSLYEKQAEEQKTYLEEQVSSIEDQITALQDANSEESKATELASKKLAISTAETTLAEKQLALEKAKNQLSVKTYTQQSDGSWNFLYSANKSNVDSAQADVTSAQSSLTDANTALSDYKKQQAYDDELQALKDQETALKSQESAIDDLTKAKKDKYDEDLKNLEANQKLEKEALDKSYSDMDTLVSARFQKLKQTYGDNWASIIQTVQTQTLQAQVELDKLTNLNVTYTVNTSSTGNSSNSSSDSSADTTSSSSNASGNSSSVTQAVKTQYNDVKEYGDKIVTDQSDTLKTVETDQKTSYTTQLTNLKTFATTYLTLTDKFLELLQIVYDFRYTNITDIAEASTALIVQGLTVAEEAYEKYQEIQEAMGIDTKSISISDVTDELASYKQSVSEWNNSKSSLYSSDAFEKFASQISTSLSSSLTSSLTSALSSAVTNTNTTTNNSTTNSGTTVTIQNVSVDGVTNVDSFMTELTSKINQLVNLKS